MMLAGSRLLVVGGTSGIGLATAIAAQAAGAKVFATGRSDDSIATLPSGIEGIALTYDDGASIDAAISRVATLDALVLAGSSEIAWGPFADIAESDLRRAFDAKFWGYWRIIQSAAPILSANGSITMITGAAARAAMPGTSGLAAVNGALEAMAKVLAVELAPLRVNSVSPGMTNTEAYAGMPPEARDAMFAAAAERLPAKRIGSSDDIAQAVLLSIGNSFLTGTTIDIDGGAHLAR